MREKMTTKVLEWTGVLTALTVAVTMFASSVLAADPADIQKLKDTGACIKCDLIAAYLKGADLSHANLSGADLKSANLAGANLSGTNLSDANLSYARMNGAILCNTTMPDGLVIYNGC
ncbi:MAG: Secreted effector protein PipB2 [Flavobacteriaceae bacterium]|nr:MAG: Secreted effector protein PipB2 [Flavobacteriaceae bacterium]